MGGDEDVSMSYCTKARYCILDGNHIQLTVGLPFRGNNFGVTDDMRCQIVFRYELVDISKYPWLEFECTGPVVL